jgi:ParB-like chromosome segregation protein Spo0J
MLAFGFTNPLLVDEAGVLIAGHGRLEAAVALGIEKVPVIVLRHLSAAQKEALRLADNRIAENATWDQALLRDALAAAQAAPDLDLAMLGFSSAELDDILAAAEEAVSDGDAPEALSAPAVQGGGDGAAGTEEAAAEDDPADAEPDSPRQAVTRPGDLWLLGEHRLLCGDSTNAASVARVMGADRAALLFTRIMPLGVV